MGGGEDGHPHDGESLAVESRRAGHAMVVSVVVTEGDGGNVGTEVALLSLPVLGASSGH